MIELGSASAWKIASRASRQYRCLHNYAVLSLLWHAEFRLRSFISIGLFYRRHTKLPGLKCARPRRRSRPRPASRVRRHRRRSRPRPGGQRARPRRRRQPRPPACPRRRRRLRPAARPRRRLRLRQASGAAGAGHGHVGGTSRVAARPSSPPGPAMAAGRGRRRRPLPALTVVAVFRCRRRPSARCRRRPSRWHPPRPRPARSLASLL